MSYFQTNPPLSKQLRILRESRFSEEGKRLRYNVAHPLQISPYKAILIVGLELVGGLALDYTAGADGIIFDDIDQIDEANSFPISRNHTQINPLNGEQCVMMKFPMAAGFVPLGAQSSSGKPHPFAGTGFALSFSHAIPSNLDPASGFKGGWASGKDVYRVWELSQFKYDGDRFEIVSVKTLGAKEVFPGFTLVNKGFNCAIADGDDLLMAVQGVFGEFDETRMCGFAELPSGVMRWRCDNNEWTPVQYSNVTAPLTAFEGTLIRDVDGSLLFTARETGKSNLEKFDVFIWRSVDGGENWKLLFHIPKIRAESPITINMRPDGAPFVAGNLLTGTLDPNTSGTGFGYKREILCLWDLTENRDGLKSPYIHRFARMEFGVPPTRDGWRIDHPVSNMVRLSDGKWRTLLTYRVMATSETNSDLQPTRSTGCYVEAFFAEDSPKTTPWNF